jgi:radical SAM protein with 4Fe4S-binding SPASM domain
MINLSKLYFGNESISDGLRYGRGAVAYKDRKPVVVWTTSRRCNLHCQHCYTASEDRPYEGELSTEEGFCLLDDLADFKVPALLMSGGEPLYRPDFPELARHAAKRGLRVTVSTNATLLDEKMAAVLKDVGVTYVGISLDGRPETHDYFRGVSGAYERTINGIRAARKAGLKVGLRLTLTRHTASDLDWIFSVIDGEGIERACFYHLVYSGRGRAIQSEDLSHAETRAALDAILRLSGERLARGQKLEILTVDQSADGPWLMLKLAEKDPARAAELGAMLRLNGGGAAGSGVGIANIDPMGKVYPDQFWRACLGDIREKPFSAIWTDPENTLLAELRDRLPRLKGRCGSCAFKQECGGSFRVRALAVHGDPWQEDPACYLSEKEIKEGMGALTY